MPRHAGRTVDYVVRLKGNVHIQTSYVIRDYCGEPGTVLGTGASGTLVFGDFVARRQGGGAALSPADAAGAVLSRWRAVFRPGSGNGNHHGAAGTYLVGLLLACCLLLLVARRASWQFRRRVCSWGKLGLLRLGMERYLAAPEPPPGWFGLPTT